MSKNLIKSNNKVSNFVSRLEEAQELLIQNNHLDFVHGDGKKLVTYIGNLEEFVKKVPSAKSYYEFKTTKLKGASGSKKVLCLIILAELLVRIYSFPVAIKSNTTVIGKTIHFKCFLLIEKSIAFLKEKGESFFVF